VLFRLLNVLWYFRKKDSIKTQTFIEPTFECINKIAKKKHPLRTIPDRNVFIHPTREQRGIRWTEGQTRHKMRVRVDNRAHAAPFFDVQHTNGLVVRGTNDVLVRGMKQHRADPILVRREGLQTHAFQRVPELYAAVPRARHQVAEFILHKNSQQEVLPIKFKMKFTISQMIYSPFHR